MSKYLILFCFVFLFFYSSLVFAQIGQERGTQSGQESITETAELKNPLGDNVKTVDDVIVNIVKALLGIVGVLALVMFMYGGILWMTAAGNSERVARGKETLTWATLGLIVIFGSYALITLILSAF